MRRLRFLIPTLLLFSLPASAFDEPTGFRDIAFGSREWEIREKYPRAHCFPVAGGLHDDVLCDTETKIADAPVTVSLRLVGEPTERRMMSILILFDPKDYELLRDALIERYGPPHARTQDTVTTRTGAKFQNETLKWSGAKTWMAIIRYADRVDQGSALITTQEFQKILRQREAERRDKARKGF